MKISVSMYSLNRTIKQKNWSIADFIHYAKEVPVQGIELLDIYWENRQHEIAEVTRLIEENGLVVSAYDITNNFVKETPEERMDEVRKVINGIYVAKQLGTNIVRVFCGDAHEQISTEQSLEYIVEGFTQCAETAEKEQVYLAIENHGLLSGRSEQIQDIIQKINSPYVKATFDTGNFLLVHEEPEKAFKRLKEDIVHVHFKDFRQKQPDEQVNGFRSTKGETLIGVIPGDGQVDLKTLIQELQNINYPGWLSIEYEGLDDPELANIEAVNRLKERLNEEMKRGESY